MGIINFFTSGKQAEEIKRAFIGAYVLSNLKDDDLKQAIVFRMYRMLCESGPFRITFDEAQKKFNNSPALVQAGLIVNSMIALGIHHRISGFSWDYIPNPFALALYSQKDAMAAFRELRKYGIDPNACFSGLREI